LQRELTAQRQTVDAIAVGGPDRDHPGLLDGLRTAYPTTGSFQVIVLPPHSTQAWARIDPPSLRATPMRSSEETPACKSRLRRASAQGRHTVPGTRRAAAVAAQAAAAGVRASRRGSR